MPLEPVTVIDSWHSTVFVRLLVEGQTESTTPKKLPAPVVQFYILQRRYVGGVMDAVMNVCGNSEFPSIFVAAKATTAP